MRHGRRINVTTVDWDRLGGASADEVEAYATSELLDRTELLTGMAEAALEHAQALESRLRPRTIPLFAVAFLVLIVAILLTAPVFRSAAFAQIKMTGRHALSCT